MRILYATDGSEGALAAVELLKQLRLDRGSEIVVLTAADPANQSSDLLEPVCSALQESGARITPEIRPGSAAEVILDTAAELQPDLLVVGSRGKNAVARFFLGSVAERVVCHAPCPVLVARPLRGALDQVVVGIDGSRASFEAARRARLLPLPPDCRFQLATAVPLYQVGGTPADRLPSLAAELRALQAREKEHSLQRLAQAAEPFRTAGWEVSTELREQHPAEGLLEIAAGLPADLIVVGRQGLGRIERFCMGSISTNVLRHASCSVLVVPEAPESTP